MSAIRPAAPEAEGDGGRPSPPLARTLADWTAGLRHEDIPGRVLEVATSQVVSHIATIRASAGHPMGRKLISAFGPLSAGDPHRGAYLLAALSSCLYYEDTLYAGHVSHAAVGVPLAHQEAQRLDGRRMLTAVTAANECASRVTAAATLGPFRGQWAGHTHIVASAAARLHGAGADAGTLLNAWGVALAAPPRSLRPAALGSNAKVLSAAGPVRTALDACDAALAGITGRDDLLEHPDGLLAGFAGAPIPEAVVAALGRRWHTETISFKVLPVGVHLDAPVECAAELHRRLRPSGPQDIASVDVHAPQTTMVMSRHAERYLEAGDSALPALNMSAGYNVATALLTGGLTVADLAPPFVHDPRRWELAYRVELHYDEELSREVMKATAPVGEALRQAGKRALDWVTELPGVPMEELIAELGPPSETFEHATKKLGCRVVVRMRDGREESCELDAGTGAVGSPSWSAHAELARHKLIGTGVDEETARILGRLGELSADELTDVLRGVLSL
ncbi:MmgE/PrpD family protein [Wenjunlia tyrosinilytica]|uniref:MmgE/PrpD family protein n=1 Tax=Wenjunlia tyrosinilytica TaxID=1544741 RepID=A0A917ZTC0_9ACTN|nr:MmgE/PrpD family protein [Wenjunlia tyrosinilytica]GGO90654.1 hypothetical protein GCM10012280_36670 [Wenjunlia tyrosinilytica]